MRWLECVHCDRWFVSRLGRRYCSDDCRRVHNIDKALGAYRLATSHAKVGPGMGYFRRLVDYLEQRDGNKCAICKRKINTALKSGPRGNPKGPSLDHVIPRSHGGADDLANIRLTHWSCNQKRGNRGGNEQLRLIA